MLAAIAVCISVLQFAEKGFLFNNAYIWASRKEREKLNKSPYYRQSAIVFCLLGAVFFVIGLSVVLRNGKIQLLEIPLLIGTLLYAIVSSVNMEKQKK